MYIQVVPKNYENTYHWSPDDGCSFGNCGSGSESEFVSWVSNGFKKQHHWGFNNPNHIHIVRDRLKDAVKKAQDAGYVISFHCGCGEGWQEPRCDGGECIVENTNKDMEC